MDSHTTILVNRFNVERSCIHLWRCIAKSMELDFTISEWRNLESKSPVSISFQLAPLVHWNWKTIFIEKVRSASNPNGSWQSVWVRTSWWVSRRSIFGPLIRVEIHFVSSCILVWPKHFHIVIGRIRRILSNTWFYRKAPFFTCKRCRPSLTDIVCSYCFVRVKENTHSLVYRRAIFLQHAQKNTRYHTDKALVSSGTSLTAK